MKKTAFFFLSALFLLSCGADVYGNKSAGDPITREIVLPDFTSLVSLGSFDVEITQGETQSVVVVGDEKSIDATDFEVVDGVCRLKLKKGTHRNLHLLVKITVPNLESIALQGSGDVEVKSLYSESGSLSLRLSGSGDVEVQSLSANIDRLSCQLMGSGDIELDLENELKVNTLDVQLSGSGDIDCSKVAAGTCTIQSRGSGDVRVGVVDSLEVEGAGSGDVYYSGDPDVKSNLIGTGSLKRSHL